VLSTEPWTREGSEVRRLFRITIRQMEMRQTPVEIRP
jgi:hypothetical protein